jgi:hypothetical protein
MNDSKVKVVLSENEKEIINIKYNHSIDFINNFNEELYKNNIEKLKDDLVDLFGVFWAMDLYDPIVFLDKNGESLRRLYKLSKVGTVLYLNAQDADVLYSVLNGGCG